MDAAGPVTDDLVQRVRAAAEAFAVRTVQRRADQPGNPRGIVIERFGDVIAPACPSRPDLDFLNRVAGLTPSTVDRVPDVVAFYRRHGVRPWFEVAPEPG